MSALERLDPAHLIGIGGRGMGSLAKALLELGVTVRGSDSRESPRLEALRRAGATVWVGHDAARVTGAAAVITNAAIRPDNAELAAARAASIPVLHRAQALDALLQGRTAIAVAGTHGKTTTSSMIAHVLRETGRDPTFVIGGDRYEGGPNGGGGAGPHAVVEADESDAALLHLRPDIAVIGNIDADHLDFYGDLEHILSTFVTFCDRVRPDGTVVLAADDPGTTAIRDRIGRRVVDFGLAAGEWTATRTVLPDATQRVAVARGGAAVGEVTLVVPGEHNVRNALAALAALDVAGVGFADAAGALPGFRGVPRRFDVRGRARGVTVVDDHAHNPAEIAAALATAREHSPSRLIAVFQPHLFSRTRLLASELGAALVAADHVIVTPIDGAREDPIPGVSADLVVDALRTARPDASIEQVAARDDAPGAAAAAAREGDLVLTIGCGNVTELVEPILARLREGADG